MRLIERMWMWLAAWESVCCGGLWTVWGRPAAAEQAYRGALRRDEGNETARLMLGDSLERQTRWDEAVRVYGELIERDPSYENAFYHRACCLMELGRHDQAAEDCRRAIALYPRHRAAYVVLGQALGRQGLCAEAITAFERAMALKPRDQEVAELLARERARATAPTRS